MGDVQDTLLVIFLLLYFNFRNVPESLIIMLSLPFVLVMKRIAAPRVGGLVPSTILTLIVIPAVYYVWRGRKLSKE